MFPKAQEPATPEALECRSRGCRQREALWPEWNRASVSAVLEHEREGAIPRDVRDGLGRAASSVLARLRGDRVRRDGEPLCRLGERCQPPGEVPVGWNRDREAGALERDAINR